MTDVVITGQTPIDGPIVIPSGCSLTIIGPQTKAQKIFAKCLEAYWRQGHKGPFGPFLGQPKDVCQTIPKSWYRSSD